MITSFNHCLHIFFSYYDVFIMTASPTGGRWPVACPVLQQGLRACVEFSKRLATVPNRSAIKLHFMVPFFVGLGQG